MPCPFNPDAPEFNPSLMLRPEAAEFIPMAGGWAILQTAAEAYQNKQKRQMPFATDEEWEQRIQKREKEVETIKSLQTYRLYIEISGDIQRGEDDPKTPDPRDRTVSKRMWKWNVEKWRLQLKSRCVYSRAVFLQCREELARQAEPSGGTDTSSAPAVGDAATSSEDVAAAGQGNERNNTSTLAEPCERFLPTTMNLQQQHATIPMRRAGGGASEAGYTRAIAAAPTATAGTFQ